ncbi:hypothetical protein PILCRDRAFT_93850 [Piloderma croceum F 1598]|uniref:HNH nuclease domain-containing protein n=1 Tax=Piloderma croceum (strain F 1598) TaxID=765440 RepID=A0A0C3B2I1_PILCF|nr:hypothetical protein PILCRDRAFT_93850 [Piloderma croceum F 1598]
MGHISRTVANKDAPTIFPYFPRKTPSNESRMKSVGAAVLEIQLGLCRWGGKGIGFGASGTGVGAKRELAETNPYPNGSAANLAYLRSYELSMVSQDFSSMCGRILGFMLLEVPSDDGRLKLASEINSCTNEEKLIDLAKLLTHFIRAFQAAKGPTPSPSDHPSCLLPDAERDMNADTLVEAPHDHWTTKQQLRKKSETATFKLSRARKAADAASRAPTGSQLASQALELGAKANKLSIAADHAAATLANFPSPQLAATNAAHIFPESTNTNLTSDVMLEYVASVWAVMDRFGHSAFKDELNGVQIHRLSNIMTMDYFYHMHFDKLNLWFEAVLGQAHTYRICGLEEVIQGLPASVTFSSHCAGLDLPDPRYLRMHAAAARVAHLLGVAAYIDDILDDLDEGQTRVMSEDGSSLLAEMLGLMVNVFGENMER